MNVIVRAAFCDTRVELRLHLDVYTSFCVVFYVSIVDGTNTKTYIRHCAVYTHLHIPHRFTYIYIYTRVYTGNKREL